MCVSEGDSSEQKVVLDVMPLTSGYLPFPLVRISKYIPGETSGTGMILNLLPTIQGDSFRAFLENEKCKMF